MCHHMVITSFHAPKKLRNNLCILLINSNFKASNQLTVSDKQISPNREIQSFKFLLLLLLF